MGSRNDGNNIRIVGMFAGVGSGLTKVAVGHGLAVRLSHTFTKDNICKGAIDCLLKTVRSESVFALYKGATPPAVGWAAIDSVLLGSLHNYRLLLIHYGMTETIPSTGSTRLTIFAHGMAGLFAGWTSAFVATPVELVKVKLQLQLQRSASDREFRGPIHCVRRIVQTNGVLGLWTGFWGSILFRSNFMWMFSGYEVLMRTFANLDGTTFQISTGLSNFLSGGLASFGFWIMAIPADNIKNRMMAVPLDQPRRSALGVAKEILRQDGARGFLRGLAPVLLRAFPVNASALFVYEGTMRILGAEKTRD